MTSRRTYTWNAYESSLNGAINTSAVDITLNSVTGLRAPGYLVIDPDIPASREFIRYETINASVIESCTRNVDGGGLNSHDDGAKIRAVPVHQFFDDIFTDIEDILSAAAAHTGAANPHSNSAAADDLVATDAVVAANTAGVAANVTNLENHETDIENHSVLRVNTAADYAISAASNVWEGVCAVGFTVPTDWVTYDLILRGGGVLSDAGVHEARVHAAAPGYAALEVDGVTFMTAGPLQLFGDNTRDHPFALAGYNHLGVITRTAYPSVSAWLEVRQNGGNVDDNVISPWLEAEARRRS